VKGTSVEPEAPLAYSVTTAAQLVGIGRTKFYQEMAAGRVTFCKVGARTIIRRADLLAYLELLAQECCQ
jgi:excisionase family DNA binding protein